MALANLRERRLSPNWRNAEQTIRNGEMNPVGFESYMKSINCSKYLSRYLNDWKTEPALWSAAELISAAISNNAVTELEARRAATFILDHDSQIVSSHLRRNASWIKEGLSECPPSETVKDDTPDPICIQESGKSIGEYIKKLRAEIRFEFRNPIAHVELARAYLRIGMWDKASREAMTAQTLAPDNRYVTRCVVKCMLHINDIDRALYVVDRNSNRKTDPWLLSTRLAIDLTRHKVSNYFKIGETFINGPLGGTKSTSELAAAVATMEMTLSRNPKVIRKHIRKSLADPIDNALAQAQWLAHKNASFDVLDELGDVRNVLYNYEADTLALVKQDNDRKAYGKALQWVSDNPFSRRAVIEASNIAYRIGKPNEALRLLELGMRANPGKSGIDLINNAAYIYLNENNLSEADKLLDSIQYESVDSESIKICLDATKGMREFRAGNPQKGEELYMTAISNAKKSGFADYADSARFNLISERYNAKVASKVETLSQIQTEFPEVRRANLSPHVRRLIINLEHELNSKKSIDE